MTKEEVLNLRQQGMSYGQISSMSGMCRSTIASICQKDARTEKCLWCGKTLKQVGGYHRLKKFCNGTCRLKYWKSSHEQ